MDRPRTTMYMGMSVDGFVARPDHTVDFLDAVDPDPDDPGNDFGWTRFWPTVDALVMGRNTYDFVVDVGQWPYEDTPVTVLTHRPDGLPVPEGATVDTMAAPPAEVLEVLRSRGAGHVYVDGGEVVQQFLATGLVDRLVLTTIPILIGAGIRPFGPLPADLRLRLDESQVWGNGMEQRAYTVVR